MASSLPDSNVRPHDRFFFSDGSLYLLVENSLYCVHKYLFETHATTFPARRLETSRSNPYVLEDVKKTDFDRLLAHLYPRTLGAEETETIQDWISILELASRWGFNSLRSKAIPKIEQTLDSPVDMVTLGHQYGIPDVLLPGYAVLCQSTVPLSYEEGLRLGMEDVVNIYRIRHELYGFDITPVPLEVAFAKVKEAGLGAERPRHELDGHASTWTDAGSVAGSQTSAENEEERELATLVPNVDSPPLEVTCTGETTLMSEQRQVDAHSPCEEPMAVASGNGSNIPSSGFPRNVSGLNSGTSESAREGLNLVEELTDNNSDLVSAEIMRWANTEDIQMLHQITQLLVDKASEALRGRYVHLCRSMMKYTQTRQQIARLIVEKAMEEPRRSGDCAQLSNWLVKDADSRVTADGLLFGKYLGEICQENLEAVTASVTASGDQMPRIQRLRLIEFIGVLTDWNAVNMWAPTIIDKWVTVLLDANDEEKVTTLCMAMTRAARLCTFHDLNNWLQRVKNVAQETSNPRVQKLLQGVSVSDCSWIVQ